MLRVLKISFGSLISLSVLSIFTNSVIAAPQQSTPTTTLLVKQYGELEAQLQQALVEKNKKKIEEFVAVDFAALSASSPSGAISRTAWIALSNKKGKQKISQLTVRELNNVQIVSFLLTTGKLSAQKTYLLIDVWKVEADNKRILKARYITGGKRQKAKKVACHCHQKKVVA